MQEGAREGCKARVQDGEGARRHRHIQDGEGAKEDIGDAKGARVQEKT